MGDNTLVFIVKNFVIKLTYCIYFFICSYGLFGHFLQFNLGLFLTGWAALIYFPHAARVLMVVYFGWRSIPGLYLAELWGPYFIAQEAYNIPLLLPSLISVMSVPASFVFFEILSAFQSRYNPSKPIK